MQTWMLGGHLSLHTHICLKYEYPLENALCMILNTKKKKKGGVLIPSKTVRGEAAKLVQRLIKSSLVRKRKE